MRHHIKLIRALVVSLMLMAIAGAAVAGPFEDAEAAYDRRDYATARRLWNSLADFGNAKAQNNLGVMWRDGLAYSRTTMRLLDCLASLLLRVFPRRDTTLATCTANRVRSRT